VSPGPPLRLRGRLLHVPDDGMCMGTKANIKGDGEKTGMGVLYNNNRAWLIHEEDIGTFVSGGRMIGH